MVIRVAERSATPRPYRDLGRRIAALREQRGLTQWELAEQAGISKSYPGVIERGENRPDPAILRRIARALDADYHELAALAGYIDHPQGDVTLEVPADRAARVRWYAGLSPRLQDLARRLLDAATDERDDVGQREADGDAEAGAGS